ncbi:BamA/TamA family outer membrane protein [Mucilaginibacter psychrotolerans]|uniref:Polymerase n=1 Tax=Mucilaginibacter psychrotolerans TaxID=1524096 RepID=A0A4Y8SH97_9SPHI|nr:polymerase [Mucilaginibacter psychrotolerans]TFF38242.1 polymerase [Mucilaginibacter psychrotolerans]
MKKLSLLLLLTAFLQPSLAQNSFLPKFIRKMYFDKDTTRKSSFVILPVLSTAPETGVELGGAGLLSFYTDTAHRETRVSNLFAYATVTTKGQSRFSLSTSYWTPQNKYHFIAAVSYINFPVDFYGTGNNTLKSNADRLGVKRFKLALSGKKNVGNKFYIGLAAGGFDYRFNDADKAGIFETDASLQGRHGGTTLYAGPTVVFDSRNNNTYTTKGAVITSYLDLMKGIGSNSDYSGGLLNVEYAQFFSLSKHFVLGFDIQEQSLTGSQSPFYLMPALGSDEMMRGYYNGRFRDRNLLAGQAELRYRISNRIGMVGFIGTGQVWNNDFSFSEFKPNYGGGLRYFFDTEKGLSIRVDYGIGEKRANEPRLSGLYIALGEAF